MLLKHDFYFAVREALRLFMLPKVDYDSHILSFFVQKFVTMLTQKGIVSASDSMCADAHGIRV